MIRWLGTNLRTFLWAFAMALAVWVAAVTSADPDEVRQFPDPIPVEIIGQDSGLVITSDVPKQIELTLRAPRSVWDQLISETSKLKAILDLSGLSAGEHTLEIQIQIPTHPVRIVSATPQTATITLEPLATRTFSIDLSISGEPAVGYQAGDPSLEPSEVVISGPQSQVERVARIRAPVSLAGARESLDQSVSVQALDENNQIVMGLGLNPAQVLVKLPISQQGGYRDLAVKVVVNGQVASGYRLANITVFPPVVTVYSADPTLVNSLPGVLETQPLDLENANDELTTRLAINLPEGVSMVGDQTVLVRVNISPIQSSLTLSNKTIEIEGLPEGWFVQVAPENVDVILSGPLPLLDTLSPQEVRVVIDVTDLDEGTHQLTPQVDILVSDVNVESILPGTVEVVLSRTPIQTPVPTPTATP
ncbi:MAG: YbbR-like domain-containing protein [Anaerolineales bacterium]|jgi:YbbR domain-containing protein